MVMKIILSLWLGEVKQKGDNLAEEKKQSESRFRDWERSGVFCLGSLSYSLDYESQPSYKLKTQSLALASSMYLCYSASSERFPACQASGPIPTACLVWLRYLGRRKPSMRQRHGDSSGLRPMGIYQVLWWLTFQGLRNWCGAPCFTAEGRRHWGYGRGWCQTCRTSKKLVSISGSFLEIPGTLPDLQ